MRYAFGIPSLHPELPLRLTQDEGECYRTCIAGITGIALDGLPRAVGDLEDDRVRADYYLRLNAALYDHGWCMTRHWAKGAPAGFSIGSGTSPRGISHAVIVKDGALWHDPHPSRAGIVGDFNRYEILYRVVDPESVASHPAAATAPVSWTFGGVEVLAREGAKLRDDAHDIREAADDAERAARRATTFGNAHVFLARALRLRRLADELGPDNRSRTVTMSEGAAATATEGMQESFTAARQSPELSMNDNTVRRPAAATAEPPRSAPSVREKRQDRDDDGDWATEEPPTAEEVFGPASPSVPGDGFNGLRVLVAEGAKLAEVSRLRTALEAAEADTRRRHVRRAEGVIREIAAEVPPGYATSQIADALLDVCCEAILSEPQLATAAILTVERLNGRKRSGSGDANA